MHLYLSNWVGHKKIKEVTKEKNDVRKESAFLPPTSIETFYA